MKFDPPITDINANNRRHIDVTTPTSVKLGTGCCALAQLVCDNATTDEEFQQQIDRLRAENKLEWNTGTRASGETCLFAVSTPAEKLLEEKLQKFGFQHIWSFKRRNGYLQTGKLKLWALNVCE